jgi:hypothetical protein
MRRNGGKLEGLAFTKGDEDPRAVAITFESRFPEGILRNRVWQASTTLFLDIEIWKILICNLAPNEIGLSLSPFKCRPRLD